MDFGSHVPIEIRAADTDNWGPFSFNLENSIPGTDVLSTVVCRVFQGKKKPSQTYASPTGATGLYTDITSLVIDPDYTPQVVSDYYVYIKFKYPGDTYKGTKNTLVIKATTAASAEYPFYFHTVNIK